MARVSLYLACCFMSLTAVACKQRSTSNSHAKSDSVNTADEVPAEDLKLWTFRDHCADTIEECQTSCEGYMSGRWTRNAKLCPSPSQSGQYACLCPAGKVEVDATPDPREYSFQGCYRIGDEQACYLGCKPKFSLIQNVTACKGDKDLPIACYCKK